MQTEVDSLSHFHAQGKTTPIEPLHGIGRHPFADVGCPQIGSTEFIPVKKYDITYLILSNFCGRSIEGGNREKNTRAVFFDLGSSSGFKGLRGGLLKSLPSTGSALGKSLPLFYKLYEERCIEFQEIFAWEVTRYPPQDWWGSLPASMRSRVHFYNVPVDEGELEDALKDTPRPDSFLQLLQASASPEDFVVVKIDIDLPIVENVIVRALAERQDLADLVDELFVEIHYYFDGLNFGWKGKPMGDVDDALKVMRQLRERGVRAHFWV